MNRSALRSLLVGITLGGVVFGALRNANYSWAVVTIFVVVVLLLAAAVGATISIGATRAFCSGACIFGWAWLLLSYIPPLAGEVRPLAAADALVGIIYEQFRREVPVEPGIPLFTAMPQGAVPGNALTIDGTTKMTYVMPIPVYFHAVSQALNALLFGVVGGLFGKWLFRRLNNEE